MARFTAAIEREYVSAREAYEKTGVAERTWKAWAQHGKITSVRAGLKRLLIPVSEVERVLAEGTRLRTKKN